MTREDYRERYGDDSDLREPAGYGRGTTVTARCTTCGTEWCVQGHEDDTREVTVTVPASECETCSEPEMVTLQIPAKLVRPGDILPNERVSNPANAPFGTVKSIWPARAPGYLVAINEVGCQLPLGHKDRHVTVEREVRHG